ncbi:hypothetical protein Bca4012_078693 [Brassica carinata]
MHTIKIEETDHEHALYRDGHRHGLELECDACDRTYHDGIWCRECKFTVHEQCAFLLRIRETSKHPFHDGHCVELLTTGAPDHTYPTCHICGKNTKPFLYHCSTCKLNLDIDCMVDALCAQADVNVLWHHHPLLMVDFGKAMICNFCRSGYDDGYFCPRCRLMVHEDCVFVFDSPEITHPCHVRHSLKLLTDGAPGYTDPECHLCGNNTKNFLYHCKICKFSLDMDCAIRDPPPVALSSMKVHEHTIRLMPRLISFACDACGTRGDRSPYYVVHSKCATREDVWDVLDLDGVPEEVEDIKPFKVNEDGTITHFAHEHNMSLNKDGIALEERILCGACVRPISSNSFYNCSDCDFVLHETIVGNVGIFDLLCSSISEPFNHGCHPHPLLYLDVYRLDCVKKTCQGCGIDAQKVLGCIKCNFFVDFRCATLPSTIRLPRYNDHPLTLCYGDENASGKYWCDICERETDPETWFYTCNDCGVTLHVFCVVGDLRYAKPGGKVGRSVELMPNKRSSRPLCNNCHCRCPGPFILEDYDSVFLCSYYCFLQAGSYPSRFYVICPLWVSEPNA